MAYASGALVRARGREWVVLPESSDDFLVLRPLAGGEADIAGVLLHLEHVEDATFPPPSPDDLGDYRSANLLRDALRIGFRSTGGPFRSLASLGVDPRPYQYVPLLMALRQDVTRLLIADDVGIGKTVEAGLVASELLAQASAKRLAVLCPPSLAEQWQSELREKFGLDAVLVLGSTVARLQRGLGHDESIFERHPITVVSTDFVKSDRRRDEFLRTAPDLVIVDEAHTCVSDGTMGGDRGRQQRYELLQRLAADEDRNLILVTATPHSGKEAAFRNLLGLLGPGLESIDAASEAGRRRLARYMVQRRRADIRNYLDEDTRFPSDRESREVAYLLSPTYKTFFEDVIAYARGQVQDKSGTTLDQRVRWWSVLSLLRSVASSPGAAVATLTVRSAALAAGTTDAANALGASAVMDQVEDDASDADDTVPGAVPIPDDASPQLRALIGLRETAVGLNPADDAKLTTLTKEIKKLHRDGQSSIVFCRFIPTAHYVADQLRAAFPKASVEVVTSELAPDDRAARVRDIVATDAPKGRILVATDCLSEGVNLQDGFEAVIHYDLAWNPTRHEQREGRVDRFGQQADIVRALTIYGEDNGIDGIVMNVLLRKHAQIRKDLGISVPVPNDASDKVLTALLEGALLRGEGADQLSLDLGLPEATSLDGEWRSAADNEKASRARYAQHALSPAEVSVEVTEARRRLGRPDDVARFVDSALAQLGAETRTSTSGFDLETHTVPVGLRDALGTTKDVLHWSRDLPAPTGTAILHRTDDRVASLARFVLDGALDNRVPEKQRPARRAGVITSRDVSTMTVLLLARFRVHVTIPGRYGTTTQIAEEARTLAFTGSPAAPQWLDHDQVDALLDAQPSINTPADRARGLITAIAGALPGLQPALTEEAHRAADELRDAHTRVRRAARGTDRAHGTEIRGLTVRPQLPIDLLGIYVYLPDAARGDHA
ncbi:helicase-related protein [Nocardioides sp. NPDC000445]|uniref:helicase-related protein n=1 Tax=Nocardioides sp. NPDC000445 TaxID=3154257 RepID=UPI003319449E